MNVLRLCTRVHMTLRICSLFLSLSLSLSLASIIFHIRLHRILHRLRLAILPLKAKRHDIAHCVYIGRVVGQCSYNVYIKSSIQLRERKKVLLLNIDLYTKQHIRIKQQQQQKLSYIRRMKF